MEELATGEEPPAESDSVIEKLVNISETQRQLDEHRKKREEE